MSLPDALRFSLATALMAVIVIFARATALSGRHPQTVGGVWKSSTSRSLRAMTARHIERRPETCGFRSRRTQHMLPNRREEVVVEAVRICLSIPT